jgi:hypothetical protein
MRIVAKTAAERRGRRWHTVIVATVVVAALFVGATGTAGAAGAESPTVDQTADPLQPRYTVVSMSAPTAAEPGERISVTVRINNVGGSPGTVRVRYLFDGTEIQTSTRTLNPGGSSTLTYQVTVPDREPGTYDHGVVLLGTGVERMAPIRIAGDTPQFTVTDWQAPQRVTSGDEITVAANIVNSGTANGTTSVEYRLDGQVLDDQEITLAAGASRRVYLSATIPDLAAGRYRHGVYVTGGRNQSASVSVESGAAFTVTQLDAAAETQAGTTTTVSATVTNVGTGDGTTVIDYRLGGRTVASQSIDLAAGASRRVVFTPSLAVYPPGEYTHGVFVGNTTQGQTTTLTVRGVPAIRLTRTETPSLAGAGSQATAEATVRNGGTADGTVTLQYRIDGRVVAEETVSVAAGANRTVTLTGAVPQLEPGTYPQRVTIANSTQAQTTQLTIPSSGAVTTASTATATETPASAPGLGVVVATLALLGGLLVASRRTQAR